MKKFLLFIILLVAGFSLKAQKVDSIYFHLYTDSLKKGMHNYINVDGLLSNGRWMPLTAKQIQFTTDYGQFEGNELILPWQPKVDRVTVTAKLISNPSLSKTVTIWIKQLPEPELPTK